MTEPRGGTSGMPGGPVVVLAGPSGAGKSRLATRLHTAYGWPVLRLDDFYRDGDDPALPRVAMGGTSIVDWDDARSWNCDLALSAVGRLVTTGAVEVPAYDISRSKALGSVHLEMPPGSLLVAEGLFAAEVIGPLRAAGLLHSGWCVRHARWLTFVRRLARDLAEHRKPPTLLLRRGLALYRAEDEIVTRMESLGAVRATPRQVERAVTDR